MDEARWIQGRTSSRQVDCVDADAREGRPQRCFGCIRLTRHGRARQGRAETRAGQSRTKGAKARARHARPLAVVRLDCRRWRRMCVCPWLFSCCRPQKTVRHPHGVDWCTQGRYLPTCANVTERWSVNVTAVHHSTLPYEEETVRAGQRQEGGTGDSKSSPGRQGQMQLPQGSRQAPTPWVQGP